MNLRYLQIAAVFGIAWLVAREAKFETQQSVIIALLAAGVFVLFQAIADYPPKPFLLWLRPKWERIQADHHIASNVEFRAWLDRAEEIVSTAPPPSTFGSSPDETLTEARAVVNGISVQWLHQSLFLIENWKMFSSRPTFELFFHISSTAPENTLFFKCRLHLGGLEISIAPEGKRCFVTSDSYVGGIELAVLPRDLLSRIRANDGSATHPRFLKQLSRMGWTECESDEHDSRETIVRLEHRYFDFAAYSL